MTKKLLTMAAVFFTLNLLQGAQPGCTKERVKPETSKFLWNYYQKVFDNAKPATIQDVKDLHWRIGKYTLFDVAGNRHDWLSRAGTAMLVTTECGGKDKVAMFLDPAIDYAQGISSDMMAKLQKKAAAMCPAKSDDIYVADGDMEYKVRINGSRCKLIASWKKEKSKKKGFAYFRYDKPNDALCQKEKVTEEKEEMRRQSAINLETCRDYCMGKAGTMVIGCPPCINKPR